MAITPEKYWPLGSTVQRITDLTDTSYYRHFGIISVNPINGHTVMIYRRGNSHVYSTSNIYIRHCTDGGITWGDDELVISEGTSYDLRGVGGRYDSTGKLFIFYTKYGVLYQPWYENDYTGLPQQGGNLYTCSYRLNLYKSTNGGDSFSTVNIMSHTNDSENFLYTEFSMINIGGGCFIILARKDGLDFQQYRQFKSEDNCNSWYDQGDTSFETLTGNFPAPPWLSFINYEGVGIVACYYTNRGTQELKVVYGLAKDLLENGPSGWNVHSPILILKYYGTPNSGYQSFFHPLNQYKGIGVCFKETDVNNIAYPVVVFTSTQNMKDVLLALGL